MSSRCPCPVVWLRCCGSTSTTSSASTTASAMPRATTCCARSPARLRSVASRRRILAARLGGDEFAIVLDDVADERGRVARRRARAARAVAAVRHRRAAGRRSRASIGVAVDGRDGDDGRRAAAQRRPRDVPAPRARARIASALFEAAMHDETLGRLELETRAPAARSSAPSSCCTTSRSCRSRRANQRLRGAGPLEPPDARPGPARRLHPARRGDRPDRADRRLGPARRVPAGSRRGSATVRGDPLRGERQPVGAPARSTPTSSTTSPLALDVAGLDAAQPRARDHRERRC